MKKSKILMIIFIFIIEIGFIECYCKLYDVEEKYNLELFKIVGQYKGGYIITTYGFPGYDDGKMVTTVKLDDIEIKYFVNTNFYYFKNDKIVNGINNIYYADLISKNDLKNIVKKFNQFSDDDYHLSKDFSFIYNHIF